MVSDSEFRTKPVNIVCDCDEFGAEIEHVTVLIQDHYCPWLIHCTIILAARQS